MKRLLKALLAYCVILSERFQLRLLRLARYFGISHSCYSLQTVEGGNAKVADLKEDVRELTVEKTKLYAKLEGVYAEIETVEKGLFNTYIALAVERERARR